MQCCHCFSHQFIFCFCSLTKCSEDLCDSLVELIGNNHFAVPIAVVTLHDLRERSTETVRNSGSPASLHTNAWISALWPCRVLWWCTYENVIFVNKLAMHWYKNLSDAGKMSYFHSMANNNKWPILKFYTILSKQSKTKTSCFKY